MDGFIGRKKELSFLEKCYRQKSGCFIPLYGRRRVGKSELALQFLKKHRGIYYVGQQVTPPVQLTDFFQEASHVLGKNLLEGLTPHDWTSAFECVATHWPRNEKLIIVLDEFQWMVQSSPELPSVLQRLWDRTWQNDGRIVLILCGSYIGFMEREVLGKKSPLFGRRTGQILLQPFSYRDAAKFHPAYSHADHARTYALCGGIPLYLKCFDQRKSVEMNLIDNFLDEFGIMAREADFLIREELREVERYYAILVAVAKGSRRSGEIASTTGLADKHLSYYLSQMQTLGYIEKRSPLSSSPAPSRDVRYTVCDPLLKFWARFIVPNTGTILRLGKKSAFHQLIAPHLDMYWGHAFEAMCREALPYIYGKEGIDARCRVGEYWNTETQIDIVGIREDNITDLCECKFGTIRSRAAVERELRAKVPAFPNPANATIALRIFAKKKVPGASGVKWHGLDDIYE